MSSRADADEDTVGRRVATRLRELLDVRGWQQFDLAVEAKVSTGTVSRLLSGDRKRPSYEVLAKVARALGTTVQDLTGEEQHEGSDTPVEPGDAIDELIRLYAPNSDPTLTRRLVEKALQLNEANKRLLLDVATSLRADREDGTASETNTKAAGA